MKCVLFIYLFVVVVIALHRDGMVWCREWETVHHKFVDWNRCVTVGKLCVSRSVCKYSSITLCEYQCWLQLVFGISFLSCARYWYPLACCTNASSRSQLNGIIRMTLDERKNEYTKANMAGWPASISLFFSSADTWDNRFQYRNLRVMFICHNL